MNTIYFNSLHGGSQPAPFWSSSLAQLRWISQTLSGFESIFAVASFLQNLQKEKGFYYTGPCNSELQQRTQHQIRWISEAKTLSSFKCFIFKFSSKLFANWCCCLQIACSDSIDRKSLWTTKVGKFRRSLYATVPPRRSYRETHTHCLIPRADTWSCLTESWSLTFHSFYGAVFLAFSLGVTLGNLWLQWETSTDVHRTIMDLNTKARGELLSPLPSAEIFEAAVKSVWATVTRKLI